MAEAKNSVQVTRPGPRCGCGTCVTHGDRLRKGAQIKADIIELAIALEQEARKMPDTVGEALSKKPARQLLQAKRVWALLGECECRTVSCGHPAGFHTMGGKCQICAMFKKQETGCWT